MFAENSCGEDSCENTTTLSPLPKVWIGFVLALLVLLLELIVGAVLDILGKDLLLLLLVINLAVFAYWLFCIHRFHRLLAELSNNEYPIAPHGAAAFHLIPIFNLYWIFKWPIQFAKYINSQGRVQMVSGMWLGFFILVSFLLNRIEPAIGFVSLFSIAMYINKKLFRHLEQGQCPLTTAVDSGGL
jgi:hypothetical protein